jgi:hypothetical protein
MEQNLWNKFSESDLHALMLSRLEAQSHWKKYRVMNDAVDAIVVDKGDAAGGSSVP